MSLPKANVQTKIYKCTYSIPITVFMVHNHYPLLKSHLYNFVPFLLSSCTFLYNYNFPFPHTQCISLYIPLMYNVKCPYIYQNLHIIFVLLHSKKSKTCMHKSLSTVLHNTIIIIQNTSTTLFSMSMYLSKLTQKFCTSAFTEIQNFCP